MRRSLLTVLLLALPLSAHAQDRQIIDVHLHALPVDALPAHVDTLTGYERPETTEAVMRRTMDQLERFNVVKAVTSGTAEQLAAYKQAAPDRIVRSLWIPVGLTGDKLRAYLDSLPAWHEQNRFQVIGEVLTQYSGIAPDDSILDPLWSFAEEEGVPVGIHVGPTAAGAVSGFAPQYRMRHGNPLALEEVLAEHPNLKVYLMHAGYPQVDDMIALLSLYPQVYVDLAFLPIILPESEFSRYLEELVRAGFADRILFGSDQQAWPQSYEASVEAIESADFLTGAEKKDIFHDNAVRFLDLGNDGADGPEG